MNNKLNLFSEANANILMQAVLKEAFEGKKEVVGV